MLEDIQGPCSTHKKFFFKLNLKKKVTKIQFLGCVFLGGWGEGLLFLHMARTHRITWSYELRLTDKLLIVLCLI